MTRLRYRLLLAPFLFPNEVRGASELIGYESVFRPFITIPIPLDNRKTPRGPYKSSKMAFGKTAHNPTFVFDTY